MSRETASVDERVSERIERWHRGAGPKTLGSLVEVFGEKGFAVLFVLLLGVPALPVPTGGATHLFEVIAMLLALELIVGRREVWLPERWRRIELDGPKRREFVIRLLSTIRWLERHSRPRLRGLFGHRPGNSAFGLVILVLSLGAFLAPPFSGLDTLPALGAVLVSVGVLLEDFAVALAGVVMGIAGIALTLILGRAAFEGLRQIVMTIAF